MALEDAATPPTMTKAEAYYLAELVKGSKNTQEYIRHGVVKNATAIGALETRLRTAAGV